DREDPPRRPLAHALRGRASHAGMGRLVQQRAFAFCLRQTLPSAVRATIYRQFSKSEEIASNKPGAVQSCHRAGSVGAGSDGLKTRAVADDSAASGRPLPCGTDGPLRGGPSHTLGVDRSLLSETQQEPVQARDWGGRERQPLPRGPKGGLDQSLPPE